MLVFGYFDVPFQALAVFVLITLIYFIPVLIIHGRHARTLLRICGVPIVPGTRYFVGHSLHMLRAEHFGKFDYNLIKEYGGVYGICEFSSPVLVVSSPAMIRDVLCQNFDSFTDRRTLPLRGLMRLSMFDRKGFEWRRLRALYTPFFSTARLKQSLVHMKQSTDRLLASLNQFAESRQSFDAQSVCNAFTLDVICASAFGLQIDAQTDPSNEFLVTLQKLNNVSLDSPLLFLNFVFPFMSKFFEFFGVTMFPSGYLRFFEKKTKQLINDRLSGKTKVSKTDFIDALLRAHHDKEFHKTKATLGIPNTPWANKGLSDREITAQALLFSLGGNHTTAQAFAFLLYNLAVHPDVQERAALEVDTVLATHKSLTYDAVSKLEYLDKCLSESLRLYPAAFRFDREASADCLLNETPDGLPCRVPEGHIVVIPVWALHHDPQYWPDPEKFDPDRFTEEAKRKRNAYVYLPFGVGPRGCVGTRFAQIEIKLAVAEVLRLFRITTNESTEIPVKLEKALFLRAKNGLSLSVERRQPICP